MIVLCLLFGHSLAILVSTLSTAQWQAMVVNASSPPNTNVYWQTSDRVLPYATTTDGAGRPCMRLLANSSIYEAYNTAAWAPVPNVPAFNKALCTARRITVTSSFAFTDDTYTPLNTYSTGLMARIGVSDDNSAPLSPSGCAAGVLGGINMTLYSSPILDFVHPNAVVGVLSLRYVCSGNVTPNTCYFSERTDLPYQRVNLYNSTFVARITAGGTLSPISYAVFDVTHNRTFFNLNLTATGFPFTMPAQRWLNANGSMPAPMLLATTILTNVTFYQLDVDIADTCMPAPPPTPSTTQRTFTIGTPIPPVATPAPPTTPIVTQAPTPASTSTTTTPAPTTPAPSPPTTTRTTSAVETSTTIVETVSTTSQVGLSPTETTSAIMTPESSTTSDSVAPPSPPPPPDAVVSEPGEQSFAALYAVGAIVFVCIVVVVILCLCRRRVKSSHRYATFYYTLPSFMRCCCVPKRSRDDNDHEVRGGLQFGTMPAYLKDPPPPALNNSGVKASGTLKSVNEEYGTIPAMAANGEYSRAPGPPASRQYTSDERRAKREKRKNEARAGAQHDRPITGDQDRMDEVDIYPGPGKKNKAVIYDRVMSPPADAPDIDTSSDSPKRPAARSQYESVHSRLD